MSKEKLTVLILAVVVGCVVVVKYISGMKPAPIDSIAARSEGPADAKVQIIEFVDFQCPSCAMGYKTIKALRVSHANDLHIQLKYFPLYNIHPHAKQATLFAECAARQGKFWEFADKVFERQQQWAPMVNIDATFRGIAKESGINVDALNICMTTDVAVKSIEQDRVLGTTLAVSSTPTFFINNKMVVGAKSLNEELKNYFPEGK